MHASVMTGHSPSKTGVNTLLSGHPCLRAEKEVVDARDIGKRSDAVLRTAIRDHDE
jgi:hypothetical protein